MRISDWSSDVCSSDLFGPHSARRFANHRTRIGYRLVMDYAMTTRTLLDEATTELVRGGWHPEDVSGELGFDALRVDESDRERLLTVEKIILKLDPDARRLEIGSWAGRQVIPATWANQRALS